MRLTRFNPRPRQINWRLHSRDLAWLTVAALVLAVNFDLFLAPANVAPGGVAGLAIIIYHFTGWPEGLVMWLLGVPMLLLGYRFLGRVRFLAFTLYATTVYTLSVDLLAPLLPREGLTDELLLNAIFGGVIGGIASGLALRGRGTFAGTGVLSRILQLGTGIPLTQLYLIIDGTIILVLGLVFGWENSLYALLMLFVWGLATDYVLEGPSVVRTAFIITERPQIVAKALLNELSVGVTAWEGQGMFTESQRTVLFCTISRPDVNSLRQTVTRADPGAFVVIGQGHQASGGVLGRLGQKRSSTP
jgi:uncharacterized membrane-anchored protein YitT (DUF2179 family)